MREQTCELKSLALAAVDLGASPAQTVLANQGKLSADSRRRFTFDFRFRPGGSVGVLRGWGS